MRTRVIATGVVLLTACGDCASAAEPQHPNAPTVFVEIEGSPTIRGTLLTLGPESLAILVDGARQEFPLASVKRVDREGDSVKDGAWIGAIAVGAWCLRVCGQGLDKPGLLLPAVVVNAGIGAVIGALVDADHKGRTRIYPPRQP